MIPAALSSSYGLLSIQIDALQDFLEAKLNSELHSPKPFTIAKRKKELNSIYQKLQTGRYTSLRDLDDLVAFTVVLRNRKDFQSGIDAILQSDLVVVETVLAKAVSPSDFRYREPKLIVAPPASFLDRHPEMEDLNAEVQFTTALQYALDYATHDFDYKGNSYSWGNFRLVAQLRGMLELVDNILDNLEVGSSISSKVSDGPIEFVAAADVLRVLAAVFGENALPQDRRRLADTVLAWITALGWDARLLEDCLSAAGYQTMAPKRSIHVTDLILVAILGSSGPSLVAKYPGKFCISGELESLFPEEAGMVPSERRVRLDL